MNETENGTDSSQNEFSDSESENSESLLSSPPTKKHICTFENCGKAFNRPWKLVVHLRVHNNEKPFKCSEPSCDKAYTKESTLKKHYEEFHKKKIQNGMCPFDGCLKIMRLNSVRKHILRFHSPLNKKPEIESFKCEICEKIFTKGSRFRRHVKDHKNYKCTTCSEQFYDFNVFRRHRTECKISNDPSLITCDTCGKKFLNQKNLQEHKKNVHNTETNKQKFKCKEEGCTKEFDYLKNLKSHVFEKHTPGSKEELYKWICSICSKKFKRKIYCKNHILNLHYTLNKEQKERKPRSDKGAPRKMLKILTGFNEKDKIDLNELKKKNIEDESEKLIQSEEGIVISQENLVPEQRFEENQAKNFLEKNIEDLILKVRIEQKKRELMTDEKTSETEILETSINSSEAVKENELDEKSEKVATPEDVKSLAIRRKRIKAVPNVDRKKKKT